MSRIAVVGAGGVGSYFAARAALAGNDVTLCLRHERPSSWSAPVGRSFVRTYAR